jgi:hypothetical protein
VGALNPSLKSTNEKTKSIAEVWVEGELRLSFRRSFSEAMLLIWKELRAVAEQISITDESDALIWGCERTGVYSSHSFYAIINYRGVTPVYIPAVWSVCVSLQKFSGFCGCWHITNLRQWII